jgi:hypothetical protein
MKKSLMIKVKIEKIEGFNINNIDTNLSLRFVLRGRKINKSIATKSIRVEQKETLLVEKIFKGNK